MIEENLWRAIRYGLDGKLIDLERAEEYPAAAALDRLLAWTAPARRRSASIPAYLSENGAQRQKRAAGGRGHYGRHLCRRGGAHPAHLRGRGGGHVNEPQQPTEEQLLEALRQIKTEDVVLQTVATLVNLAGQKLSVEGAKDPAEAQKAIDAARQMLPLVPEEAVGPIQNALDQVQMLYAQGERRDAPTAEPPQPPPPSKIWTPGS